MRTTNVSILSSFFFLGFSDSREIQILHALLFMVMYMFGLAGNLTIITITTVDPQLQSPIYLFLKPCLTFPSCLSPVPQFIHNSLTGRGYISYAQCVLQVFFFTSIAWSNLTILTVMSYDHSVAICLPLHYGGIMGPRRCRWPVTAVWISGGIPRTLYTATVSSIRFCKVKIIHHFFCDVPQLLKLYCSDVDLGVVGVTSFMSSLAFACFIAITFSYVQIFCTVLRMLSAESRSKVFSTCLPHLCVISFFLSTGVYAYLKATSDSATALDLMLSIFYTVLPLTFNPLIYSLRNEVMKRAIRKLLLGTRSTS